MSKRLKAKGGKTCRMQNTLNQIPVFLCCLWCGLAAGIIYDLFRLVRIRGNRFATAAADTLFGAIAIGITAGALLYCDHGKIRFFTLFAIAAGALLWQILPGKLLRIMIMKLKRSIKHIHKKAGASFWCIRFFCPGTFRTICSLRKRLKFSAFFRGYTV